MIVSRPYLQRAASDAQYIALQLKKTLMVPAEPDPLFLLAVFSGPYAQSFLVGSTAFVASESTSACRSETGAGGGQVGR